MANEFDKAAGMLSRSARSSGASTSDADAEGSRKVQANLQKHLDKAFRKGDHSSARDFGAAIANEQKVRTKMHQMKKALPQYKEGGVVAETGPALVHEGELVIPKDRAAAVMSGGAPAAAENLALDVVAPKVKKLTIIPSANDGFVIEVEREKGEGSKGKGKEHFALSGADQILDAMRDIFGIESPEEEAAELPEDQLAEEEAGLEEPLPEEDAMAAGAEDLAAGEGMEGEGAALEEEGLEDILGGGAEEPLPSKKGTMGL